MNCRRARLLVLSSLLPLLGSAGCDALTVRSFAGTIMQFTMANVGITPAGQHLELWARDQYNDIIRVNPFYDLPNGLAAPGLMIRQAISLDDPCLIDAKGNLLTTAAAYPTTTTVAGVTQTPEQQAQQVRDRISQLSPPGQAPLLAVLPYDATPPPTVPKTASAAERKMACDAYRGASDRTYIGNPVVTAPTHGFIYGFVRFVTTLPPVNYDGFRLDTPVGLKGVQEIFFTIEGNTVDANNRGPLFLISTQTPGGRDVVHFDLIHADPLGQASGAAALYVNLDQDPVQF